MNIESIKRRLLVKYPFFGSVVANSNFIADAAVETAGTDGKNIYYNPCFIESVTDDQQTFIFAHEICHIAFDHVFRSEGKDKDLWNMAADSVTNAFLKQDGLSIIEGGVDIPEAINYDVEEMYNKLLEEKKQHFSNNRQCNNNQNNVSDQSKEEQNQDIQGSSNSAHESSDNQNGQSQEQSNESNFKNSSNNSDNQNEQSNSFSSSNFDQSETKDKNHDVGHDTHSIWTKAIENKQQEERHEILQPDKSNEQEKKMDEEIKKLKELGEKEVFKQNKIERRKQLEGLRESLVSQSHGYGSVTYSEVRNISDIGVSAPLIDWRRLLKEAVKYDIDWSYQNAFIEDGVVTPYLEETLRPETEIVLDTSGSINETMLKNFLRECKNILQTSKVKVGCFDTQFHGFTEVKKLSDIDNLVFYGNDGTNFNAAVHAFTKRVENKIIFTDGEASMPDTPIDAIWVVFGGKKINPAGGKVIYINDEQLERLCDYQSSRLR